MPFHKDALEKINAKVKKVREDMDIPFDELFHKERKLVLDIIRMEKILQEIRDSQPSPIANRLIDLEEIVDDDVDFGNAYKQDLDSQFVKDQRRKIELEKHQRLLTKVESDMAGDTLQDFEYNRVEQDTIEQLISSGQVSREQYEAARAQHMDNRMVNLGYAFVTFSHADEARQMLLSLPGEMQIENNLVEVMPKGKLDHSELDKSYCIRRMKNEAQMADQKAELREAKKRLREFEQNIDKELPKTKRLQEFKQLAQEILENSKHKTRRHESQRRTKREQEELNQRMRELQKEYPDLDLTQLFESEQAQKARREMHKRAF